MHFNFAKRREDDGSFTLVITVTGIPDEQQLKEADLLVKRALLEQGAAGIIGADPFGRE